ncbi:MAG: PhoX family phosphatase [Leptolyngbya sp. SIOISBB]|nr:PhoX family phosphatase [Leptolyngbya sp. SIOISBB]
MVHDNEVSNKSGNRPFEDVLKASMSRRHVLMRSAAFSATGFLAALAGNRALVPGAVAAATGGSGASTALGSGTTLAQAALIGFAGLGPADGPVPSISADYEYSVVIPWGTSIQGNGSDYTGDPTTRPSAAEQAEMVGIGHDGMWFFPINNSNERGMLAINHEFGRNTHVLGKADPESLEDVRLSQHAHGVSVVEIRKNGNGTWQNVSSPNARRIHVNTPVTFSGPAAGSPLLETPAGNAPLGTVNNCANGYTPWGTYLTCEENFNGYFGTAAEGWEPTAEQDRYGFSTDGFGYSWHLFDPRFDLANPAYRNEENRFGWIVEIDPMDGTQTPVKRTALGRVKHEGIALTIGKGGRAVGYMGDDQRFDYIYKYVSSGNYRAMLNRGISPLDEGKLYAARFNDDGTGDWLEMTIEHPALAAQFADQAEVLTFVRLAADTLGATPMDRPEWTTYAPKTGEIFCTLTNNSRREVADAANPVAPNANGHIMKIIDDDQLVGTTFKWEIFVNANDASVQENPDIGFGSPDGLWADPDGRLFIETDGRQPTFGDVQLNDQMLVADANTGEIRRLFVGVNGCEVTGIAVTPDRQTMFINLQHPGNGDPTATNFPAATDGVTIPRDATVVITRKGGGIVGS